MVPTLWDLLGAGTFRWNTRWARDGGRLVLHTRGDFPNHHNLIEPLRPHLHTAPHPPPPPTVGTPPHPPPTTRGTPLVLLHYSWCLSGHLNLPFPPFGSTYLERIWLVGFHFARVTTQPAFSMPHLLLPTCPGHLCLACFPHHADTPCTGASFTPHSRFHAYHTRTRLRAGLTHSWPTVPHPTTPARSIIGTTARRGHLELPTGLPCLYAVAGLSISRRSVWTPPRFLLFPRS